MKLRSQIQPKHISFEDYEDFIFANGRIKEGIFKKSSYRDEDESDGAEAQKPKIQSSDLVLDATGSLVTKYPTCLQSLYLRICW